VTESIESHWAIKHGSQHLTSLAVQQIVSCAEVYGSKP
jgi:hypothetical protein